jgi:hypothetical protein
LNEFDLPNQAIVANRLVLVNTAPDLGANNDTNLQIADAGVRYIVPESTLQFLLGLGALTTVCFSSKSSHSYKM